MKRKTMTTATSLLALMLTVGTAHSAVSSVATDTSTITQLTDFASTYELPYDSREPDISRDGRKVVFVSDADLTGQGKNPDNINNLFVMNTDGSDLRQLTFVKLDPTYQTNIYYDISAPRLSADGKVIAFASTNNLTGDNPPVLFTDPNFPDNSYYISNSQIFIINSDGTGLKQLTKGTAGNSKAPKISHGGDIIAFESTQDLLGENDDSVYYTENPVAPEDLDIKDYIENTKEIYVIKADGSSLTQITNSPPKPAGRNIRSDESRNVSISGDGRSVAFDSFADLISGMNDDHSNEIFVFDLAKYWQDGATIADHADYTIQVTDTDIDAEFHIRAEDSFEPSLDYDGSTIAFSACINPKGEGVLKPNRTILGNNPWLPDVIFYAELDIAKRDVVGDIIQLTFSDDEQAYADDSDWTNIDDDAHWPEISDDGRRIVFGSRSRVDIINPDKLYEMAMIDLDAPLGPDGAPVVEQLTFNTNTTGPYVLQLSFDGTDGARLRPSISANADKIVLRADSDFSAGNPDGNSEIFMIEPSHLNTTLTPADEIPIDDNSKIETLSSSVDEENSGAAAFGLAELLLAMIGMGGIAARRRS